MTKYLAGAIGILSLLLLFAVKQWSEANEARALEQMGRIVAERNVATMEKERAEWDKARKGLSKKARQDKAKFKQLANRYETLKNESKKFLDLSIPDGLLDVLRDSDAAALRNWLHTAEGHVDPADIAAAYSSLTNRNVYSHRELCIQTLNRCNDRLIEIGSVFYGEKKPD